MHMAPNAAVVSSSPELDCLRPSKPLSNLQGGASASDAAAMLETLSSSSAWAAAVVVPKERRPWNQVLRRMVQRSRAAHDPLMSPSTKDFDSFAHSVARRAECGLLESIGDAIASPLPRSETHMVGVKADCDLEVQGEGTAQGDSRSFYAPQLFSGKMDESGDVADPALCDSNVCRLAISEPSRSRAVPLAIPNIAVPTRLGDNLVIMSCSHNEIAISETGSSPASSIALGPLLLRGISVQYGIQISQLKRLNRIWNSSDIATRDYLYIPLRMCSPKFSVAYIEYANAAHQPEMEIRHGPGISTPYIDLIEVALDPAPCPSPPDHPSGPVHLHPARKQWWPLVTYESIQRHFSFVM
ncbi:hypothetical protein BX661DRAFT_184157 [Kickxella alabastrina]|uniref:uncharacterized protein n=1 Tax=Kickxella alabastrina TaxID=61397 RepID=UPI00221F0A01|nr:uncharacterized protein BX661DRAFT_184157 [Kickxella alabastrina]KAI7825782.1 hypothetical protein BX661DRAFT_184157 [Kickxella alabastrina]